MDPHKERLKVEDELFEVLATVTRRFLSQLEKSAIATVESLTAAAVPKMSQIQLEKFWTIAFDPFEDLDKWPSVYKLLGKQYQQKTIESIAKAGLGDEAFTTVETMVNEAYVTGHALQVNKIKKALDFENLDAKWKWKTQQLAITNATSAYGFSSMNSLHELGSEYKKWGSINDARTRESHSHAAGQVRATEEPFDVGGYSLMYPGDPTAPYEEIVNCRCIVQLATEAEAAAEQAKNEEADEQKQLAAKKFADYVAEANGDTPNVGTGLSVDLRDSAERLLDLSSMSLSEQSAWNAWTGSGYRGITQYLRTGSSASAADDGDTLRNWITSLDALMIKRGGVTTAKTETLYRGMGTHGSKFSGKLKPGMKYTDNSFMAVTSDDMKARDFSGIYGHVWNIEVPEGIKYLAGNDQESEVIFERGLEMQVINEDTLRVIGVNKETI